MTALTCSNFLLIDLHPVQQLPSSTLAYLQTCTFSGPFSSAFRRTRSRRGRIASSGAPARDFRSIEIRRPRDWATLGNGLLSVLPDTPSTSGYVSRENGVVSDMELFLEIVPLRIRQVLYGHEDIDELIEVVMDLGRKPIARFPAGDWVISEDPVKLEDLEQAISKVDSS